MGTVISSTKVTAMPRPAEVFTVFDTARYEHMPRKKAKIMLSTNIDLMNMLMYSIVMHLCLFSIIFHAKEEYHSSKTFISKFQNFHIKVCRLSYQSFPGMVKVHFSHRSLLRLRCHQMMSPTRMRAMGGMIIRPLFS